MMRTSSRGRKAFRTALALTGLWLVVAGCGSGPAAMDRVIRPDDAGRYRHYLQANPGRPAEAWLAWRSEETGDSVDALRRADAEISKTQNPFSPKDVQAVRLGALVYSQSCVACHGEQANGLDASGQPLPGQKDFTHPHMRMALKMSPGRLTKWYKDVDEGMVGDKVMPDGTQAQMPAMGKLLTREQIWLALNWLASDKAMEADGDR